MKEVVGDSLHDSADCLIRGCSQVACIKQGPPGIQDVRGSLLNGGGWGRFPDRRFRAQALRRKGGRAPMHARV
jgi:hypothetical protein